MFLCVCVWVCQQVSHNKEEEQQLSVLIMKCVHCIILLKSHKHLWDRKIVLFFCEAFNQEKEQPDIKTLEDSPERVELQSEAECQTSVLWCFSRDAN